MAEETTGADQGNGASVETPETQNAGNGTGYAGFDTPDELVSAYQDTTSKVDALTKQISDLERIKGDNSGTISQLNERLAKLTGEIEGMRNSMSTRQDQGPTIDDIERKLEDGEISEGQALRMAAQITERQLSQKHEQQIQERLSQFEGKLAEQREIDQFLQQNPGYVEALKSGKLDQWMQIGSDGVKRGGREAWTQYQLQATKAELDAIKQKAADAKKEAEAAGVDKGIKLEKSKGAASKVLNGNGGRFSQVTGKYDLSNTVQRGMAGQELLQRMRSGA